MTGERLRMTGRGQDDKKKAFAGLRVTGERDGNVIREV